MNTRPNARIPQAQAPGVPVERPQVEEHWIGPGGPSLVLSVIVALLVGGLVGYFLRSNVEPTRRVTRTLTKTVTETVAPDAYTTSDHVQARVAFDGSTCSYNGPAEVAAGTRVTFSYDPIIAEPSTTIIISLLPDMTYEDVAEDVATYPTDRPPMWARAGDEFETKPHGKGHQSAAIRLDEGVWAILCATSPEGTNTVYMGTMLRVVGS